MPEFNWNNHLIAGSNRYDPNGIYQDLMGNSLYADAFKQRGITEGMFTNMMQNNPQDTMAMVNGIGSNSGNSGNWFSNLFGESQDQNGNILRGGATGFQWAGAGLGALNSLYGMYQGNKQLKLAKDNFEEQKALSRANYTNTARAYNNNLRNQQSGRGYGGMSGAAKRTLGEEYERRKAAETYR